MNTTCWNVELIHDAVDYESGDYFAVLYAPGLTADDVYLEDTAREPEVKKEISRLLGREVAAVRFLDAGNHPHQMEEIWEVIFER